MVASPFLYPRENGWETLSNVRQGLINIQVNRFDARGSVLYWGIFEQTASIMRIPIGTTYSEAFWTCEGNNCCIGCHALAMTLIDWRLLITGVSFR